MSSGSPKSLTLSIQGFKSIRDRQTIELRPLTLLAGSNSSGKSSLIQPLLLLKQTLDAAFDADALRLDGDHVQFSQASQLFWTGKRKKSDIADHFSITVDGRESPLGLTFRKDDKGVVIDRVDFAAAAGMAALRMGMSSEEIERIVPRPPTQVRAEWPARFTVNRRRWMLQVDVELVPPGSTDKPAQYRATFDPCLPLAMIARSIIHLPGLRGSPARHYPATGATGRYLGPFPPYTASVIHHWQEKKDARQERLGEDLRRIGLTWKVQTKKLDDTRVELNVGRLPSAEHGGAQDVVNIADVGLGISQVLPILVALAAAEKGEVVYIEQPEIHLHPRAQVELAGVLLDAAMRGVIVVAETHSQLLLKAVQVEVAKSAASSEIVKLHWVTRDESGATTVASANLDSNGAFGDWPEDFANVELSIEDDYLIAVCNRP